MPLTPATKAILSRIRKLQPDNQEFIFYRGDSHWQQLLSIAV